MIYANSVKGIFLYCSVELVSLSQNNIYNLKYNLRLGCYFMLILFSSLAYLLWQGRRSI